MTIRLITSPPSNGIVPKYSLVKTSWDWLGFACRGSRLIRLILPGLTKSSIIKSFRTEFPNSEFDPDLLQNLQQSLIDYFHAKSVNFNCQVDISWATPFARKVYQACSRIKPAQTVTYANLAQQAGSPKATRAVGSVMAANHTPLIIPCHRVLCSDGKLGGFSAPGGVSLKKQLISHESKI
jgi:methylated-DNA-[protein]-cysteine S-methyltransferase